MALDGLQNSSPERRTHLFWRKERPRKHHRKWFVSKALDAKHCARIPLVQSAPYGSPSNNASVGRVRGPLSSQTAYFAGYIETPACSPRAFRT